MHRSLPATIILAVLLCWAPALAGQPEVGDTLPDFSVEPFAVAGDAAVLGLPENRAFVLGDIDAPYIIIEVLGVYCPICHKMAPSLTRLYKRLKKARLDDKVAVLGIAAGGTAKEVLYVRDKEYIFPVAPDAEFVVHKQLGEPKTPFTMIVDKERKVLYACLGTIPDFDAFFKEIKELAQ